IYLLGSWHGRMLMVGILGHCMQYASQDEDRCHRGLLFLKVGQGFFQMFYTGLSKEHNPHQPSIEHKITDIGDTGSPKIVVYREDGPFFIRIKTRLKKSIAIYVKYMVHINVIIKRPFVLYRYLAHKTGISLFCPRIFFRYKIVEFNMERQFMDLGTIEIGRAHV